MVRHAWSILCSKTIIEHGTGNISIIDVIDEVSVHHAQLSELEDNSQPILLINMSIVSTWNDDINNGSEELSYLVSMTTPSEKSFKLPVQNMRLLQSEKYRGITNIDGIPYDGEGEYFFRVELVGTEARKNDEMRCNIPFTVKMQGKVSSGNKKTRKAKVKKAPTSSKKKVKTKANIKKKKSR